MNIVFAAKQTTTSFSLVQAGGDFAGYKIGTDVMMSHCALIAQGRERK